MDLYTLRPKLLEENGTQLLNNAIHCNELDTGSQVQLHLSVFSTGWEGDTKEAESTIFPTG
jgi:hypothetical protein